MKPETAVYESLNAAAKGLLGEAESLTDRIRGSVKQGTLWHVSTDDINALRAGIRRWLAGSE